ncbi:Cyclin-like domain-containing protein [Plasmodiophora brassicae]
MSAKSTVIVATASLVAAGGAYALYTWHSKRRRPSKCSTAQGESAAEHKGERVGDAGGKGVQGQVQVVDSASVDGNDKDGRLSSSSAGDVVSVDGRPVSDKATDSKEERSSSCKATDKEQAISSSDDDHDDGEDGKHVQLSLPNRVQASATDVHLGSGRWPQVLCDLHDLPTDLHPRYPQGRMGAIIRIARYCRSRCLSTECLHLAVDYLDRYLVVRPRSAPYKCNIVGAAAVLVASKILDQRRVPPVKDLCLGIGNGCPPAMLVCVETLLCTKLQWRLHPLLALHWIQRYLVRAQSASTDAFLWSTRFDDAVDLLSRALLHMDHRRFQPAILAAAILYLVCDGQRDVIAHATGTPPSAMATCLHWVAFIIQDPDGIYDEYIMGWH